MKTIYLVVRHDYNTKAVMAFETEEAAEHASKVLENAFDRVTEVCEVSYFPEPEEKFHHVIIGRNEE